MTSDQLSVTSGFKQVSVNLASGDRLYEITYERLTANPETVLRSICIFLGLDSPSTWIKKAIAKIRPTTKHSAENAISLPPTMCQAFNRYREHFGFANRATFRKEV